MPKTRKIRKLKINTPEKAFMMFTLTNEKKYIKGLSDEQIRSIYKRIYEENLKDEI